MNYPETQWTVLSRRLRMLKLLAFARKLRVNTMLFQGVGLRHKKDKNPEVVSAAKRVLRQGIKVRLYLDRGFVVIYAHILLRSYSWRWLSGSRYIDSKFWLTQAIPAYKELEDQFLDLAFLVGNPHVYAQVKNALLQDRGQSKRESNRRN